MIDSLRRIIARYGLIRVRRLACPDADLDPENRSANQMCGDRDGVGHISRLHFRAPPCIEIMESANDKSRGAVGGNLHGRLCFDKD